MYETDYLILQELYNDVDGRLIDIFNRNFSAHLTVCPVCHVDDFQHIKGCSLDCKEAPKEKVV